MRKSAKQCKARWHEWLDPMIKKTEWTRDEDERLLHLAKLMPTQWRTIAPIVGRTAAQCLERYEKLLDAAVAKEDGEGGEDPRRLRPGEIDPAPESKPARPDAVDMEEDEKEMLSEARARLANTRGKKAKRKAREKGLEEARRLASLQKRRELKAAGIVSRGGTRRVQGIDYNAEIAFEKKAPAGFFDTAAERSAEAAAAAAQPFRPVSLSELEGPRRKDIEEALMRRDAKRQKVLERKDAPGALAQLAAALGGAHGGPAPFSRLLLPPPVVSEAELHALARLGPGGGGGDEGLQEEQQAGAPGLAATRTLLQDYAPSAGATPQRTPRAGGAPGGGDYLVAEAQNLARLQAGATPLLGGANPTLHPSDFSGATPRHGGRTGGGGAAAPTPGRGGAPGGGSGPPPGSASATPARLRDALAINAEGEADGAKGAGSRAFERARAAAAAAALRRALAALPPPRNDYVVVVPDLPDARDEDDDEDGDGAGAGEDAADAEARAAAAAAEAKAAELRARSAAVRRGLPRPVAAPGRGGDGGAPGAAPAPRGARALLAAEVDALVGHDAAAHPPGGGRPRPTPALPHVSEARLAAAGALLRAEAAAMAREAGDTQPPEGGGGGGGDADRGVAHASACAAARACAAGEAGVEALRARFTGLREDMGRGSRRAAKLEAFAALATGPHAARLGQAQARLDDCALRRAQRAAELEALTALHARELAAAPRRLEAAQQDLDAQLARERGLQGRYARLTHAL